MPLICVRTIFIEWINQDQPVISTDLIQFWFVGWQPHGRAFSKIGQRLYPSEQSHSFRMHECMLKLSHARYTRGF